MAKQDGSAKRHSISSIIIMCVCFMCSSDASVIEDKDIKFQFGILQMSISMYFAGLLPKIENLIGSVGKSVPGTSMVYQHVSRFNPMFTLG